MNFQIGDLIYWNGNDAKGYGILVKKMSDDDSFRVYWFDLGKILLHYFNNPVYYRNLSQQYRDKRKKGSK